MLVIKADSAQQGWYRLLQELVYRCENSISPRGIATQEILGVTLRVNDLRSNIIDHPVRNINPRFMVAEWLWVALGCGGLAAIARYNGQLNRFSDDGVTLAGAYGPRLATQWNYVLETLRRDPASRQAVASIWTPNPAPSKDIPCTLALQLIARDGRLSIIATMRSSDAWLGIPYDVFTFSQLANGLAGTLGLAPGFIQLQLGSSHLYEDNVAKAREVLATSSGAGLRSPPLPERPPLQLLANLEKPYPTDWPVREPWRSYARILDAETWHDAHVILKELGEQPD